MPCRAQERLRRAGQELGRPGAQEVGAGRSEAHHGDVGAGPRHGYPPKGLAAEVASPTELAVALGTSEGSGVKGVKICATPEDHSP